MSKAWKYKNKGPLQFAGGPFAIYTHLHMEISIIHFYKGFLKKNFIYSIVVIIKRKAFKNLKMTKKQCENRIYLLNINYKREFYSRFL